MRVTISGAFRLDLLRLQGKCIPFCAQWLCSLFLQCIIFSRFLGAVGFLGFVFVFFYQQRYPINFTQLEMFWGIQSGCSTWREKSIWGRWTLLIAFIYLKRWEPLSHYLSAFCRCYLHKLPVFLHSCREVLLSVDFTQRWTDLACVAY